MTRKIVLKGTFNYQDIFNFPKTLQVNSAFKVDTTRGMRQIIYV